MTERQRIGQERINEWLETTTAKAWAAYYKGEAELIDYAADDNLVSYAGLLAKLRHEVDDAMYIAREALVIIGMPRWSV